MIILTKIDNRRVLVQLETIKYCESIPDTMICFLNGDTLIVRESLEDIQAAVVQYQKKILNS